MFKRRTPKSYTRSFAEFFYPPGGWGRASRYVVYRLRRLPDPPYRIARGIFAGVAVTFTPFYGFHFIMSALLALAVRGNVLAALLATFFGNPLTLVPIGVISLKTGHFLLGTEFDPTVDRSLVGKFTDAWKELFSNLWASFTGGPTDWQGLQVFYSEVFLPFTVGGIIPGLIAGMIAYYLSVPIITAYQKRRFARLRANAEKRLKKRQEKEAKDG